MIRIAISVDLLISPGGSFRVGHDIAGDLRSVHTGGIFLAWIAAECVFYLYPRDDPVFPALEPVKKGSQTLYTSNITTTSLACVDIAQICDPGSNICQDQEIHWNYSESIKPSHWPLNPSATETEWALALLYYSLFFSSTMEAAALGGLDVTSKLRSSSLILPKEQWKVEARRWFEISLARMQVEVLNLAQGGSESRAFSGGSQFVNVMPPELPPEYRGMCHMVKFRSNGWRNVSVWALFGVLFLAAGISLGSVKNGEETVWLCVAARRIFTFFWWLCSQATQISWRRPVIWIQALVTKQWQATH